MLPPREVQPTIGYVPVEADPYVTAGLPMDTYELESCPISGFMISAHKAGTPDSFCWQVGATPYRLQRLRLPPCLLENSPRCPRF